MYIYQLIGYTWVHWVKTWSVLKETFIGLNCLMHGPNIHEAD